MKRHQINVNLEIPLEQLNLDDPETLFMLAEAHSVAYHLEKRLRKRTSSAA